MPKMGTLNHDKLLFIWRVAGERIVLLSVAWCITFVAEVAASILMLMICVVFDYPPTGWNGQFQELVHFRC